MNGDFLERGQLNQEGRVVLQKASPLLPPRREESEERESNDKTGKRSGEQHHLVGHRTRRAQILSKVLDLASIELQKHAPFDLAGAGAAVMHDHGTWHHEDLPSVI